MPAHDPRSGYNRGMTSLAVLLIIIGVIIWLMRLIRGRS